jgi:RHS repeat-associated protein
VYFDDFKVTVTPTNVIQGNEYYPFSLQTANSWTRTNSSNNYLYNEGSELNSVSGLYDLPFRNYDASVGRFFQVDPLAHVDHAVSPFAYGRNNPIGHNDPTGLLTASQKNYLNEVDRSMGGSGYSSGWSVDASGLHENADWNSGPGFEDIEKRNASRTFLKALAQLPEAFYVNNGNGVLEGYGNSSLWRRSWADCIWSSIWCRCRRQSDIQRWSCRRLYGVLL